MAQRHYIGIDLGTTFSAMAYLDAHGKPVTITNSEGMLTTASAVLVESRQEVIVGREARLVAVAEPQRVALCAKRDMGERYYSRPINGRQIAPEAISALILKKLKQDAERKIGPIAGAVITVPAYFNDGRRQATIAAGEIAGIHVVDILNEPTAAALAYAYRDMLPRPLAERDKDHHALVFDLGGGTFDVTVLRISGNHLEVLATDGDVNLGGNDWDDRIAEYASELFRDEFGEDPIFDPNGKQNLLNLAEEAKRTLSHRHKTRIPVHFAGRSRTVDLTRQEFEEMTADLLYRTERRVQTVVAAAQLEWSNVDVVLAVGGSTRMPMIQEMLQRLSGRAPNLSLPPDEAVAHGAAIHAALRAVEHARKRDAVTADAKSDTPLKRLEDDDVIAAPKDDDLPLLLDSEDDRRFEDAAARHLRINYKDGKPLSAEDTDDGLSAPSDPSGGAAAPNAKSAESSLVAPAIRGDLDDWVKELQAGVGHADLLVADNVGDPGEQTLAGVAFNEDVLELLSTITTTNVAPHSLGVVMKQDDGRRINSIIIPRNSQLPCNVTQRYGTIKANQQALTVRVVEGESEAAEDCQMIGSCRITELPRHLPKGSTIFVTFSHDGRGHLFVKAVEATSGDSSVTIIRRTNTMDPTAIRKSRAAISRIKVS